MKTRIAALGAILACAADSSAVSTTVEAQSKAAKPAAAQKVDEEYTRLIKQNLQDPRIRTEARAQQLRHTTKPTCDAISGMHWSETGGPEMLIELAQFVQEGATLITEGSTVTIFTAYGITTGVTVEEPPQLFVRGSILRAKISDVKNPIAHGYGSTDLPVYFNQSPVLHAGGGGRGGEPDANPNGGIGQNVTPPALPLRIQPVEADASAAPSGRGERPPVGDLAQFRQQAQQFGITSGQTRPRVVMQFAANPNDMLLSGTLRNSQFLANRAGVIDSTLGKSPAVMLAIKPFWRWQTQGADTPGFNAIINWSDLDAGNLQAGPRQR